MENSYYGQKTTTDTKIKENVLATRKKIDYH